MKQTGLKESGTKFTRWKKKRLKNCRLYCILDIKEQPLVILRLARKITSSGVDIIQLRDKSLNWRKILKIARILKNKLNQGQRKRTIIIINDRPDIARLSGVHGVHLGQQDLLPKDARAILGKDKIIGISCHNLAQAIKAQKQGADYISMGPIYATPTKRKEPPIGLDVFSNLSGKIKIPVFAIGGINNKNLNRLKKKGIQRIAVFRAIVKSLHPEEEAAKLKAKLN